MVGIRQARGERRTAVYCFRTCPNCAQRSSPWGRCSWMAILVCALANQPSNHEADMPVVFLGPINIAHGQTPASCPLDGEAFGWESFLPLAQFATQSKPGQSATTSTATPFHAQWLAVHPTQSSSLNAGLCIGLLRCGLSSFRGAPKPLWRPSWLSEGITVCRRSGVQLMWKTLDGLVNPFRIQL